MQPALLLRPHAWAKHVFGTVDLGDRRRTRRLVDLAARMLRRPDASFPAQMHALKALKAAYRFFAQSDVTHPALLTPHYHQTRHAAARHTPVLFIQDTTELNYTHHPATHGLGPVGDGKGRGFLLQTVLAVLPKPRQVLGLAYQEPFLRQPAPPRETRAQRRARPREAQVWERAVAATGEPPPGCRWVHVGDAYSDIFDLLIACLRCRCDFLLRAAQDRCVQTEAPSVTHLFPTARALPAQGEQPLRLPARHGTPAREAVLSIAWGAVTLLAPQNGPRRTGVTAWVIRVWEAAAPPEVSEPLEWVLLTSVPTLTPAAAWERVAWYTDRWLVEDYHQCLKSGCRIEQRQLQDAAGLIRCLGILAPIAMRLLQLREIARWTPERLATKALPRELVQVVARLAELPVERLTVGRFWREVARWGGYLGRRRDGPPGWQTLWQGWLYIQAVLEGVHLARELPP